MTTLNFDGRRLTVTFPSWELLMAGRSSHTVDIDGIDYVEALPGWSSEILGIRSGLVVSGYRKLGTFRHPDGTRRLVSMSRGLPLLRVRMRDRDAGAGFDELLISDRDAAEIAADLGAQAWA
ncbi:hypothetical protein FB381_1116 [Nocardioides albertanoniae]|uniref:Uncharacterized protein n=1 Tax=Nocardioides albertanoniae TaxID=1175486 RepID=A0A543A3T4_9ACTN|nr:hypothetical protein [Nocardioides albertanoniae]TQL67243.1 hypothetical protein FB381_1116 [Nocardioides albertanoniae]